MKQQEMPDDQGKRNNVRIATEVVATGAGVAAGATGFWLALRQQFNEVLKKTPLYDEAKKRREASKIILNSQNFKTEFPEIQATYKADINAVHKELGMEGISLKSMRNRLKIVSKNDKVEALEKAGTFGFMAATLVIGCGVLLEISKNQTLKHQMEAQDPAPTQTAAVKA